MTELELAKLAATDFRAYLLAIGCATDEQIAELHSLGYSGGGLLTWTKERAEQEIAAGKVRKAEREKLQQQNANLVRCWECGRMVDSKDAKYDGNGWYCGC
jgi:hypothetical protein